MTTYTWPLTINGVTFTAADFEPYAYVTGLPNLIGNMAAYLNSGNPALAALGALTPATDKVAYFSSTSTAALTSFTTYGRTLVAASDAAAVRSAIGTVIGTDVLAHSPSTGAGDLVRAGSPAFTGAPTAPTAAASDNSTQLATTAFVKTQGYIGAAGAPVQSIAGRTGAVTLTVADVSGAAPLASPTLSGAPTAPTAANADSSTRLATTAFVKSQDYITSAGAPVQSVAGRGGAVTLAVADVSGAAPLASPALTGTPTAPTASAGTNTTQIASTAFVRGEVAALVAAAPGTLDTLNELAGALGNDANFAASMTTALATKAPLASPALTGTPTAPTASAGDNSTQLATTAFVKAQDYITSVGAPVQSVAGRTGAVTIAVADVSGAAALASPALIGTPTGPTAAADTSTTQLATTAFVVGQASAVGDGTPAMDGAAARGTSTRFARADHVHPTDTTRAPLASPALTGTPTAPTAAADTSTTQIATTAFVKAQGYIAATGTQSITIDTSANPASLTLDSDSTYIRALQLHAAGVRCWWFGATAPASDFFINRYDDSGNLLGEALNISRATGSITTAEQILAPDFPAGGPSYSFTNAPDAGMYLTSAVARSVRLIGGTPSAVATGGEATVVGGSGGATSGNGGRVRLLSGIASEGNGGAIDIIARSGATTSASNRDGGAITITAGNATLGGSGGNITLAPGASPSGAPGYVIIASLPTAAPSVSGAIWDDGTYLRRVP